MIFEIPVWMPSIWLRSRLYLYLCLRLYLQAWIKLHTRRKTTTNKATTNRLGRSPSRDVWILFCKHRLKYIDVKPPVRRGKKPKIIVCTQRHTCFGEWFEIRFEIDKNVFRNGMCHTLIIPLQFHFDNQRRGLLSPKKIYYQRR